MRRALVSILACGLLSACHHRFSIDPVAYSRARERPPQSEAVHPYPGVTVGGPRVGDFLLFYFSTDYDLERSAPKLSHHLYFQIRSCSTTEAFGYVSGEVFRVRADEARQVMAGRSLGGRLLFKVYVPLDLESYLGKVSGGGDSTGDELKRLKADGVCLRIGGAQMWYTHSLFSQYVQIPIRVEGTAFGLKEANETPIPLVH
jgi:hypothetical protein